MKIAIFTDTFPPDVNGVARMLSHYTDYLKQKGIEFIVFAPNHKSSEPFSNHIYRFMSFPFFLYPECRLALPNYFKIKAELRRFQPDIIHIVTPFNIGICGLRYAKKFQVPVVGSYHTNFDQYLSYYDLQFLSKFFWKYMRWFYRHMFLTFVPSRDTLEQLKKRGFTRMNIWGSGVDCELFHPHYDKEVVRKSYHIQEPLILSYVGRLAPEKEVDTLMKIAHSLPEEVQKNVHWLITGDGPSKEEMEKIAPPNMTFTGYLDGEDLARVYATSDLFIFPSVTETFGNVVLEALASGTPVIAAKAGGVQNIIKHMKTGILCEPGEINQFIDAIQFLLLHHDVRQKIAKQARTYALAHTWDHIFDILLESYESVLNQENVLYA